MNDWRPIETAPKDGTKIDVWVLWRPGGGEADEHERLTDVWWSSKEEAWVEEIRDGDYAGDESTIEWSVAERVAKTGKIKGWEMCLDRERRLTHWMPLPEPPHD